MKNIYLIVGPSGSGKTTVVNAMEKQYGYTSVQSYTTRPPRYEGETGHIFVSEEEFDTLKTIAENKYNGYRYGTTKEQIKNNVFYVIDIPGVRVLRKKYKGGTKVIFLKASPRIVIERMQKRGDKTRALMERLALDDKAFSKEEQSTIMIDKYIDASKSLSEVIAEIQDYITECENA